MPIGISDEIKVSGKLSLFFGKILLFGDNQYGQLGFSNTSPYKSLPYDFNFINSTYDGTNCVNFSFGETSSSMLLNSGKVYNFGNNICSFSGSV